MRVKIDVGTFPKLSEALGTKELEMNFTGVRIKEILDELISRHGPKIRRVFYDENGQFDPMIQIIRNGEDWIPAYRHNDSILQEGDTLCFVVLLAGG